MNDKNKAQLRALTGESTPLEESKKFKTLTSMEVAEMIGRDHSKVLRDIRNYIEQGAEAKIGLGDYFIESTYLDANNQSRPCFNVTKKGCEFIASKMTGPKGTEFSVKFINRFHDMEDTLKEQIIDYSHLSPELQMFKQIFDSVARSQLELQQMKETNERIEQRVESIREVVSLDTTSWRDDTSNLIKKIAQSRDGGKAYQDVRAESYELLNKRLGVDVKVRLTNKRRRMADEGVCKSRRDKLSYLDVIADDKKLIEGYVAIVKEMAIKYGVA